MSQADGAGRIEAFLSTLEKLPPLRGVTFRGCSADAEFVRDGQAVVTQGLVPTSRNIDVATEGGTTPAIYAILSLQGRDISSFSAQRAEREVVFLPGTLFYLAETRELAGHVVRLVFELPVGDGPPRLPDRLVPELAANVDRFLTDRGPQPLGDLRPIPGKFAGDID